MFENSKVGKTELLIVVATAVLSALCVACLRCAARPSVDRNLFLVSLPLFWSMFHQHLICSCFFPTRSLWGCFIQVLHLVVLVTFLS
ncbi:hypothetical protein Sjap_010101 [Stephania japonica]|uniref:Uncharacterized protein n=1 Tax=Stephania japonica TaxID=461633 RepID=A0AAP0J8S4_9MAGN